MRQRNYEILEKGKVLTLKIFPKPMSGKDLNKGLMKPLLLFIGLFLLSYFAMGQQVELFIDLILGIWLVGIFHKIYDNYNWLKFGYESLTIDWNTETVYFFRKHTKLLDEVKISTEDLKYFGEKEVVYPNQLKNYDAIHLKGEKATDKKKNTFCFVFRNPTWKNKEESVLYFGAVLNQLEVKVINTRIKNFIGKRP